MAWRHTRYMIVLLGLMGCASFTRSNAQATPAILHGSNAQIRQQMLKEIPVGTSQAEALRIVRSLGLEPQTESDLNSGKPLILCNYTGKKGLTGEVTWLVQIDCPEGKVTDILCEQIGVD